METRLSLVLVIFLLSCSTLIFSDVQVLVSQNGGADFKSIAEALDAVPANNTQRRTIFLKPGVYREKIIVTKEFVTLVGQSREEVTIVNNCTAGTCGGHTWNSSTFTVEARYFIARRITFMNDAPKAKNGEVGKQAVALRIAADFAAFYECNIISSQDTLYDQRGKHFFKDCYIEGNIDFIFGAGQSLYENCEIFSSAEAGGAITAQRRQHDSLQPSGFVFLGCSVDGMWNGTSEKVVLGRPWGDSAFVVFAYCELQGLVAPHGWRNWAGELAPPSSVFFAEYNCDGPGANRSHRVPWSRSLTNVEALPLLSKKFVNGDEWIG